MKLIYDTREYIAQHDLDNTSRSSTNTDDPADVVWNEDHVLDDPRNNSLDNDIPTQHLDTDDVTNGSQDNHESVSNAGWSSAADDTTTTPNDSAPVIKRVQFAVPAEDESEEESDEDFVSRKVYEKETFPGLAHDLRLTQTGERPGLQTILQTDTSTEDEIVNSDPEADEENNMSNVTDPADSIAGYAHASAVVERSLRSSFTDLTTVRDTHLNTEHAQPKTVHDSTSFREDTKQYCCHGNHRCYGACRCGLGWCAVACVALLSGTLMIVLLRNYWFVEEDSLERRVLFVGVALCVLAVVCTLVAGVYWTRATIAWNPRHLCPCCGVLAGRSDGPPTPTKYNINGQAEAISIANEIRQRDPKSLKSHVTEPRDAVKFSGTNYMQCVEYLESKRAEDDGSSQRHVM